MLRAPDRTLTVEECDAAVQRALDALGKRFRRKTSRLTLYSGQFLAYAKTEFNLKGADGYAGRNPEILPAEDNEQEMKRILVTVYDALKKRATTPSIRSSATCFRRIRPISPATTTPAA